MTWDINRPELSQALQRFFNIKGTVIPVVDQTVSPVLNVGDLFDTPALRYAIPVSRTMSCAAGGAGIFSFVTVQPGARVALQIKKIEIPNETGASILVKTLLLTAAELATFTPVTAATAMFDLSSQQLQSLRPSTVRADQFNSSAFSNLGDLTIPANTVYTLTFPDPGITLYGNDDGGIPGVAIVNRTAVSAIKANFYGREWPLPGQ